MVAERVERTTGVATDELRALVALLTGAARVMVLTARGGRAARPGHRHVLGWIDVALALGMPGKPYAGYGCLTGPGQRPGRARARQKKADQLPGYRMIDEPAARAHVAGVWGVPADSLRGKGRSAYELLDSLGTDDGQKALLVHGSNIVVSAPNATRFTGAWRPLDCSSSATS
ncbi:hypothetical protein GCM10023066_56250 [Nocardioides kongjuensis]